METNVDMETVTKSIEDTMGWNVSMVTPSAKGGYIITVDPNQERISGVDPERPNFAREGSVIEKKLREHPKYDVLKTSYKKANAEAERIAEAVNSDIEEDHLRRLAGGTKVLDGVSSVDWEGSFWRCTPQLVMNSWMV